MLDIIIQNGRVIDGTGAPAATTDVGVQEGRIVSIGELTENEARTMIDAEGCVVTPGFIDMHSHADFTLPVCPTADSLLHQGITTAVVGQCGVSPYPLCPETRDQVLAMMEGVRIPWAEWTDLGSYLRYIMRAGISINVVPLVGHGMIRAAVLGYSPDPASAGDIEQMQAEIARAMDQGAIGVSTGLMYPPGSYASTEELIQVLACVGERGGYYFSHIRGESGTLLEAIGEAVEIGWAAGTSVQISHLKAAGKENWDKLPEALELIRHAREQGLDISSDAYPYTCGSTDLVSFLPEWAQAGGKASILSRLRDMEVRDRMRTEMATATSYGFVDLGDLLVTNCPERRDYEGRSVGQLAHGAGSSAIDWVLDALRETHLSMTVNIPMASHENIERLVQDPTVLFGTDGFALEADSSRNPGVQRHPRSFGTFPRLLGRFVREKGLLGLEEAIHRMTGLPARRLRLKARGILEPGYAADLVVFDPDTVEDTATYAIPENYARGIRHVVVNGQCVVHEEAHTDARPGVHLGRSPRWRTGERP